MGYYYEQEQRPQYYAQPPPRVYRAPSRRSRSPGVIVEVDRRPRSPSPTRVIVVEKRRREEPMGFLPWLCGGFCCCWICADCVDDCWGCCPASGYDSD